MALAATLLLALACLVFASSAAAVEVQGWDNDPNFSPSQKHYHVTDSLQNFQRISGPTQFTVRVLTHNNTAHVNWVRWSCESDVKQVANVNWQSTGAFEEVLGTVTLTISPSQCPGLYREIRVSANVDNLNGGDRTFTTTRLCLRMGDSGTNYCGGPTVQGRCGGGAWYTNTLYSVAFVDCRDVNKAQTQTWNQWSSKTMRIKSQDGNLNVHLDPDFHHFNAGTVLRANGSPNTWYTVSIPSGLATGFHKLVIRSTRSNGEEGVYVQPFAVVN